MGTHTGTRDVPTLHPRFCEEGTRFPGSRAPGAALAGTGCWCDPEEPAGLRTANLPVHGHLLASPPEATCAPRARAQPTKPLAQHPAAVRHRCRHPRPRRAGEAVTTGGPEKRCVPWVPPHCGHMERPFQQGQDSQCSPCPSPPPRVLLKGAAGAGGIQLHMIETEFLLQK